MKRWLIHRVAGRSARWLFLILLGAVGCPGIEGDLLFRVPQDLQDLSVDDSLPVPPCITTLLGDAAQCETELAWLDRAAQACVATGGRLSGWSGLQPCGATSFRYLKYSCCPNPSMSCTPEVQGGPAACKDEATWRASALLSCSATGTIPIGGVLSDSCGTGLYRYFEYRCCPPM
jgi:hypothetical protein